ncbi:hypothetical protein GGI23_001068 [Coemansia sp. RSA 2559]|nr:hypothetical protein GGI23_001068 [Coemansia sp. RSA 2559]
MGSPLGGTMVFRNLSFDEYLMGGVGYHNIFHPYDPFGYRTEPLVDDSYADTPAVPITSSPGMHGPESLSEEKDGSSVAQMGGGSYHYRRAPHRQSTSLGGYVTDIGRTVVDAMVIAPITISSTMLRAAKSTVSAPVNAMARRMSNTPGSAILDEESADPQHPRKLRHRMSMLLGVSSAAKQGAAAEAAAAAAGKDQVPSALSATRKSFSWIVPSRSSHPSFESGNKHHQRRTSLSRLLHHSRHRVGDKSSGSTLRASEAGGSIRWASGSNSSDMHLSSESKRTAQEEEGKEERSNLVASPTPLSDANAEENNSNSSEQQYQPSPLVAAAVSAMSTADTAQQREADSDTKSGRQSTSSLLESYSIAASGPPPAPQHNRHTYDASYDSIAVDSDDMVDHIMRIFSLSRPPSKRQQLAEAQGLPLSSHLLSSTHCHYGVPISTSLTTPYNNSSSTIAPGCSSSLDIVHKHEKKQQPHHHRLTHQKPPTKGRPLHSGRSDASEVCRPESSSSSSSSSSERLLAAGVRRSNTLPLALADGRRRLRASSSARQKLPHHRSRATETRESPPRFQKAHTTIGSSSSQADDETASGSSVSAEKEATMGGQNAASDGKQKQLPYPERMDYIIPFTKRHLQNEYWLGFQSHFSYWTSKEVVYHILYHMVSKPMPQEESND